MKPSLTIGIPTYNRANIIGELLNDIFSQVSREMLSRLEVLISDNASDDDYLPVIQSYSCKYPNTITYRRCEVNCGFSGNVDNVVRYARNDFVLIMSDDDGLTNNALQELFSILDSHPKIGLSILSFSTYSRDMSEIVHPHVPLPDKYYEVGGDYIREIRAFTSALISGYVFKKKSWLNNHAEKYLDVNSIHLIMGALVLATEPFYAQRSHALIKYRKDMGQWSIETDPLYPFPMFASYLKGCAAIRNYYPTDIFNLLYCTTLRTVMGFTIRNKVLRYHFPRSEIRNLLKPYLDRSCLRNTIFTNVMLFLLRVPWWLLYVPFRWLVPVEL